MLTTILTPKLKQVGGYIDIFAQKNAIVNLPVFEQGTLYLTTIGNTTLNLPLFKGDDTTSFDGYQQQGYAIGYNPNLTSISMPAYIGADTFLEYSIFDNPELLTIDISSQSNFGGGDWKELYINGNDNLHTITHNAVMVINSGWFYNNNLSTETVDSLLAAIDAGGQTEIPGYGQAFLYLHGNNPPTGGDYNSNVISLRDKDWIVQIDEA